jgi:hypothetical protein
MVTIITMSMHNDSKWLVLLTVGFTSGPDSNSQIRRWDRQNPHLTFQNHSFHTDAYRNKLLKWSYSPKWILILMQNERDTVTLSVELDLFSERWNWVFCCFHLVIIQYKHSFYIYTLYLQSIILYLLLQSHILLCLYTLFTLHSLLCCFVFICYISYYLIYLCLFNIQLTNCPNLTSFHMNNIILENSSRNILCLNETIISTKLREIGFVSAYFGRRINIQSLVRFFNVNRSIQTFRTSELGLYNI